MSELDVIVFGATGFTGQLTAEYLLSHHSSLRIGLAGRSAEKLAHMQRALAEDTPAALDCPLIVANSMDRASLDALCERTRVVCTTVGPYAMYGQALAKACAASGTHYCDLTGEVTFIRWSIDQNTDTAAGSGARLIHCCGFDSVPSDMGTWMVQQEAVSRFGRPLDTVVMGVRRMQGAASGGTIASMLELMRQASTSASVRRLFADPYSLNPSDARDGPDGVDRIALAWSDAFGGWVAPFVMAPVNTRVVRRTNAILNWPYGADFQYRELVSCGPGLAGLRRALAHTATFVGLGTAMLPPMRWLLSKALPSPGEGPSREERERGHFTIEFQGHGVDAAGGAVRLDGTVRGFRDPGYGETAKMLGEAAACLALDDLAVTGGVWTPAAALGQAYLERLRGAGMIFEVT